MSVEKHGWAIQKTLVAQTTQDSTFSEKNIQKCLKETPNLLNK